MTLETAATSFFVDIFAEITPLGGIGLAARQLIGGDFFIVIATAFITTAFDSLLVPARCAAFQPLRPPWPNARSHRTRSPLWASSASSGSRS